MNNRVNKKIIDLMWTSVNAESGDGDAIWLSKHTSLEIITELVEEYCEENNLETWILERKGNHLLWGVREEWIIITDDKEFFKSQPDWIILKIDY